MIALPPRPDLDLSGLEMCIRDRFGTVAIMRLWLSRSSTSVGEALGFAASMLLTILAVQILSLIHI